MCTQFVHNFFKKILIMEYTLFGLSSCVFEAGVRQTLRDLKQDTISFLKPHTELRVEPHPIPFVTWIRTEPNPVPLGGALGHPGYLPPAPRVPQPLGWMPQSTMWSRSSRRPPPGFGPLGPSLGPLNLCPPGFGPGCPPGSVSNLDLPQA